MRKWGRCRPDKYLEAQAALHDYGLVYESTGTNNLVRARKGLGQARFVVNGKASHAGGAHEQGRSAIKELAYKLVAIENLTDYETGVTVNVGIVSGGEARNETLLPVQEGLVDLRYPTLKTEMINLLSSNQFLQRIQLLKNTDALQTDSWVNHAPPTEWVLTVESDYLAGN